MRMLLLNYLNVIFQMFKAKISDAYLKTWANETKTICMDRYHGGK